MILEIDQERRDRLKSAIGVAAIHGLLGYVFITGLGAQFVSQVSDELKLFDVTEEPPPPPAVAAPPDKAEAKVAKPKDPEGAASPANLRDTPTEIMAPEPMIRLEVPPPITAAPAPGQGNAASAGAADIRGPGTGSGGQGTGLGSGLSGSGTGGGGGGGGRPSHARWISGSIRDSDYPRRAFEAGIGGTVYLQFVVETDGRVSDCEVTRSSGSRELDSTTCRLLEQRLRYRPARDARGRPVPELVRGEHEWVTRRGPDREIEPDIID